MAQDTIYRYVRRDVSGADLNDLAQNQPGPWFYGERPQDTVLIWAAGVPPTGAPWQSWRHARLFGPDGELSWWREVDGSFTCRLLARADVNGWGEGVEYTAVAEGPDATLLHGEYDENSAPPTWSEARIPRVFSYPVDGAAAPDLDTRVVLLTRTYRGPGGDLVDRLVAIETREIVEGG